MLFSSLQRLLVQLTERLTIATAQQGAVFELLQKQLADQAGTIAFLTDDLSKTKIAAAAQRAELRQTEQRLAAAQRDFEWARVRLNGIEVERAELIRRLIDTTPNGPPMHFPAPMIESKLQAPPVMAGEPATANGTAMPDDPMARMSALVDLFRDEREAEDGPDEPPLPSRPS